MSNISPEEQWVIGARKALEAAKHLLESGDYELALFTCHLAVEKAFKAKIVTEKQIAPPRTHNLTQLASILEFSLSDGEKMQLRELSSFAEFARYGDETWVTAEATEGNTTDWLDIATKFLSTLLS